MKTVDAGTARRSPAPSPSRENNATIAPPHPPPSPPPLLVGDHPLPLPPPPRMLEIAEKIVEQQKAEFDPSAFVDRYARRCAP